MSRDLIPELHDILKVTTLRHDFEDFGPFQACAPDTRTWRGVLQHHCSERFPAYPTDRETFLLHMADGLAANFSRKQVDIQGETAWTVYRVWNPKSTSEDERLSDPKDIRKMLEFLGGDPTYEEFRRRYEHVFQSRAEDAHPGMNVTTLDTHVRLVGQFYRFLQHSALLHVSEEEVGNAASRGAGGVSDLRERKQREWQIHLIRCRPRLLTNPFRARDLNIFACLEEFLEAAGAKLGDNILFAGAEELLLCCDDLKILDDLMALAARHGIALDIEKKRQRLDMANLKFKRRPDESLYPALEANILPPLCEICQMSKATRVWPQDYLAALGGQAGEVEEGRDYLCETCFAIRSRPSRLKKLAHWRQGELVWVRFGLDFYDLHESLRRLYLTYLRSLDAKADESKAEVRFSLVAEFQQDYQKYLAHVGKQLLKRFGEGRTEVILPDFFCVKAESGKDVLGVLRCLGGAARAFFPAFVTLPDSPLRLSLTFCDVRYPFFEIWREWQEQQSEIEVRAVGHGELALRLKDLEKFLQLSEFPFRKSALHDLAEISRISEQLAELRFRGRGEKGERPTFEHLSEFLPLGLKFEGILTLAKLLGT
jgi:hypothetical protein